MFIKINHLDNEKTSTRIEVSIYLLIHLSIFNKEIESRLYKRFFKLVRKRRECNRKVIATSHKKTHKWTRNIKQDVQIQFMVVPRLGAELELQPPGYTTATAMPDPSSVCHLHHSSWQCQILLPTEQGQESNLDPHGY